MTQRKVVKNVTDMEFDEISVVDRGGNQFADVVIAKRAPEEETHMPELFNEEGELLSEDSLEDGQIVYDVEGNAYEFELDAEADVEEETEIEDEVAEELEPELVGKGFADTFTRLASRTKSVVPKVQQAASQATYTKPGAKLLGTPGKRLAAGTAVGAAGGAGAMSLKKSDEGIRKSFSEEVMEELSKAMSDEDRDQVISKALGAVEELLEAQAEAVEIAKAERELRLTNEYIAKAAEYNLPVDPAELGPVLYRMVEKMDHDDCAVIAKCLDAASTALFDEVGYVGGGDNIDPLERVNALVGEQVAKSEDAHDAFLNVMDSNPAAYDEYLATRRGF